MEPVEIDAAAKMFEATSSFGIVPTFWFSLFIVSCLNTNFVAGVPSQGALASREPDDLPEGSRGDMSTSTATEAAVLDALYGDLPPYRPELTEGIEVKGVVVPEMSLLPTISMSEAPSVMARAELRVITSPVSYTHLTLPTIYSV